MFVAQVIARSSGAAAAGTDIPVANVVYDPFAVNDTNITAVGTPIDPLTLAKQDTIEATGGTGTNSASWDPQLVITIPPRPRPWLAPTPRR